MPHARQRRAFDAIVWSLSLALGVALPLAASAGQHRLANDNPAYRAECGTCHIAYPAGLLGADGWRTIMSSLDRHFGTDASLDAPRRDAIARWLESAAGGRKVAGAARITETGWFVKEHRAIARATWTSPAVKRSANCEACHRGAAAGDFDEHAIRIPGQEAR